MFFLQCNSTAGLQFYKILISLCSHKPLAHLCHWKIKKVKLKLISQEITISISVRTKPETKQIYCIASRLWKNGPLKSLKTASVRPLFYQQILAIIRLMPGIACDIPGLSLTRLALASVSVEYTQIHWRTAQCGTQCSGRTTSFLLHQ